MIASQETIQGAAEGCCSPLSNRCMLSDQHPLQAQLTFLAFRARLGASVDVIALVDIFTHDQFSFSRICKLFAAPPAPLL